MALPPSTGFFLNPVDPGAWEAFSTALVDYPDAFVSDFADSDADVLKQFVRVSGKFKGADKRRVEALIQTNKTALMKSHRDTKNPPNVPLRDVIGEGVLPLASAEVYNKFLEYMVARKGAYEVRPPPPASSEDNSGNTGGAEENVQGGDQQEKQVETGDENPTDEPVVPPTPQASDATTENAPEVTPQQVDIPAEGSTGDATRLDPSQTINLDDTPEDHEEEFDEDDYEEGDTHVFGVLYSHLGGRGRGGPSERGGFRGRGRKKSSRAPFDTTPRRAADVVPPIVRNRAQALLNASQVPTGPVPPSAQVAGSVPVIETIPVTQEGADLAAAAAAKAAAEKAAGKKAVDDTAAPPNSSGVSGGSGGGSGSGGNSGPPNPDDPNPGGNGGGDGSNNNGGGRNPGGGGGGGDPGGDGEGGEEDEDIKIPLVKVDLSALARIMKVSKSTYIDCGHLKNYIRVCYKNFSKYYLDPKIAHCDVFALDTDRTKEQDEVIEEFCKALVRENITIDLVTLFQAKLISVGMHLQEFGIEKLGAQHKQEYLVPTNWTDEKTYAILYKLGIVKKLIVMCSKAQIMDVYFKREFGVDVAEAFGASLDEDPEKWSIDPTMLMPEEYCAFQRLGLLPVDPNVGIPDDKGLAANVEDISDSGDEEEPVVYEVDNSKKKGKAAELLSSLEMPLPLLVYETKVKIHKWVGFWQNLILFMKHNKLSEAKEGDCAFAIIMTKLQEVDLVCHNIETYPTDVSKDPDVPANGVYGLINAALLHKYVTQLKPVCLFTLGAFTQGGWNEMIPWYDGYCAVVGDYLTEPRLRDIMKEICKGGNISQVMDSITIGFLRKVNDFFKFRFNRLSTPGQVRKALEAMPYDQILKYFPASSIREYRRFYNGGIAAQIAAGPMKMYCVGKANPYKVGDVNPNLPLSQLQSIDAAPFCTRTIKLAGIILQETKSGYGSWKQLKKAQQMDTSNLHAFRSLVRATLEAIAEPVDLDQDEIKKMIQNTISNDKAAAVRKEMALWKKSD